MVEGYIEKLRALGFDFSDTRKTGHSREKLKHYIPTIGLARFHDYAYPFLDIINSKKINVGTDNILRLYRFDRKLRLLTMDAVERIEVSLRGDLDMALRQVHGDGWHTQAQMLNGFANRLFENIQSEIDRTHLMRRIIKTGGKYSDFPSSRVLDNVSFGRIEILLDNLPADQKTHISRKYKLKTRIFSSWVKSTRDLRNTAAHHSRLWNRTTSVIPIVPHEIEQQIGEVSNDFQQRFYAHAIVMQSFLKCIARNSQWKLRLRRLVEENNVQLLDLKISMGFPDDWWETEFWK